MDITLDKNAFVITNDDIRYIKFVNIFNHFNLPIPIKFSACRSVGDRGIVGCTRSHYAIYKIAQTMDLPYVIVFEDDVFPRHDIVEYFDNAIKNVPEDWTFLKIEDLFFNKFKKIKKYNDYWFYAHCPECGSGSAAYIIKKEAYIKLISEIEKTRFRQNIPIDFIFQLALEMPRRGFYISSRLMFIQHNLHGQKKIHERNFKNDYLSLRCYNEDSENFIVPEKLLPSEAPQ